MLKIGDFSRLSRVSIRMLRYYDEAGLIKPVTVDKYTGYRYYREEQLHTMSKITVLRDMGFGVGEIGELLQCEGDKAKTARIFAEQRSRLGEEAERLGMRMKLLDDGYLPRQPQRNAKSR